ncbi:rod shape-determining protein RodA [Clostridium paraputrificum]|uniref:Rod shape-determining protein RodA n=1 Tax=Clostridium paraputrificum TaxID=29363 RepID=A0A1B8RQ95_9CLOT|nr:MULTISPECIES: rod shape-determining protein RodA [Clostridium]MBS6888713.1 rod shape-determining protein RodA [Clostridium sp.]MDB2070780.1 rod shape-determining protein RodA [Clostridium paraputrificum]MDB2081239.1 rod shape-determining protein RodA [Clostridium paraputrificum]MDB2087834.1 rod shape-determining protein RodA [Clostridium paraputrificum]MDB2094663.1 rod shape-determining protein RodA [Clostridium paraputrificum]
MLSRYKLDFKLIREIDKGLLFSAIALMLYGMLNIYLCTKGDVAPFFFVKKQFMWFIISMVALYFLVAVDYSVIYRYVPVFYWGSVILLLCVWIPGIGVKVNGARGWINIGISNLQPAELAKFGIILMVAKLLEEMDYEVNNLRNIIKIGIYCMIPVSLILIQPDMGMTMVCFFIVLGMLFIAGLDRRIIIGGFSALLIGVVVLWNSGLILPHQKARITAFMNPETDTSAQGYQLNQSLIGIGSGGVVGTRPSLDPEVSPGYAGTHVPEIQTDFIFAAIGEQWGFLGAMLLLLLYGILITKMINIARKAKDRFASLVCIGLVSYFLFAITQNIGMTIGLIPITGITLPLISYGGSSLLTTTMAVGLVLNIGMRKKKIHF